MLQLTFAASRRPAPGGGVHARHEPRDRREPAERQRAAGAEAAGGLDEGSVRPRHPGARRARRAGAAAARVAVDLRRERGPQGAGRDRQDHTVDIGALSPTEVRAMRFGSEVDGPAPAPPEEARPRRSPFAETRRRRRCRRPPPALPAPRPRSAARRSQATYDQQAARACCRILADGVPTVWAAEAATFRRRPGPAVRAARARRRGRGPGAARRAGRLGRGQPGGAELATERAAAFAGESRLRRANPHRPRGRRLDTERRHAPGS